MNQTGAIEPITAEVIWNGLLAAAYEMKLDLERSAHSPIINENHDCSVALLSATAETLAQAPGLPEFVCDIPSAVITIAEEIGGFDRFEPDDIYITNDPYANTLHVNDVNVIKPIFWSGQLVGFACARAHWLDIGGASGSGNLNATEVFQEGLLLPTVRLYNKGELNQEVIRIIRANSRMPDAMVGDLQAQLGACRVGEKRFLEILDHYGYETVHASMAEIFRNSDIVVEQVLKAIPEGTYESEAWLDNDGVDLDIPLRIHARVTVKDTFMTIDLSESATECRGPMHCNYNTTRSICRMIFKMLTTPDEPANEGHFRRLKVVIPERSIFNSRKPSATLPGFFALETLMDVVKSALAPAVPERVNAHDYGKCTPAHIKGWTPDGRYFSIPDTEGGGWGGSMYGDGESALRWGEIRIIPIEVLESKFPVQMVRYTLRQGSGGVGKFRGGLGIIKEYLCLTDVKLNAALDRQYSPPQGILGGGPSIGNRVVVRSANGQERVLPSIVTDYPIKAGEIISFQTSGGGGYGSAIERNRAAVREDLEEGLIGIKEAQTEYGLDPVELNQLRLATVPKISAMYPSPASEL